MPEDLYPDVPVRDGLAAERTVLAAERTFLAYVRTAFAMFVAGLTGVELLATPTLIVVAYLMTGISFLVFMIGLYRFARSRSQTKQMLARLVVEDP